MYRTWTCRALPRYYQQLLRSGAARKRTAGAVVADAAAPASAHANNTQQQQQQQQRVQHNIVVNNTTRQATRRHTQHQQQQQPPPRVLHNSDVYLTSSNAALQRIATLAQSLLQQWRDADKHDTRASATAAVSSSSSSLSSSSSSSRALVDATRVRDFVCFAARRDVFAALRSALPPSPLLPSSVAATTTRVAQRQRRGALVVVPDDMVDTISNSNSSNTTTTPLSATATMTSVVEDDGMAHLSLEQLVVLLELYACIDSDDGVVLRQLLDEVHRFVTCNMAQQSAQQQQDGEQQQQQRCRRGGVVARDVRLPLPALLAVLSQLHMADDRTLTYLTASHNDDDSSSYCSSGSSDGATQRYCRPHRRRGGVLYAQLSLYNAHELLTLLVALYRFRMQQHNAFVRSAVALRQRLRHDAACRAFCAAMRAVEQKQCNRDKASTHDTDDVDGDADSSSSGSGGRDPRQRGAVATADAASYASVLPPLPPSLRDCDVALLVEALTALSLSSCRPPELVQFVAHVVVVRAVTIMTSLSARDGDTSTALHALSRQLLRAAQVCECVEAPSRLLAHTFALSCSVAGKGVIVDGGQAGEVASECVAYYDDVTADLIKLRHV